MLALLIFLWFFASIANCIAAPIVGTIRWGLKGFLYGIAAAAGCLGTGLLLMAATGVLERTWSISSMQVAMCVVLGAISIFLVWWGWRRILQPHFGPGQCAACGYALEGLRDCPECGRLAAGTQAPIVD